MPRSMPPELFVTCAPSGAPEEADDLAARFPGVVAVDRRERPLHEIVAAAGATPVLVLGSTRADLYVAGRPFRATAGMAFLRVLRAVKGEVDPLVRDASLRPGDEVLDATLGLGGDALVAAQATGARVLGIEKSALLAAFSCCTLRRLPRHGAAPGRLVEVVLGDHRVVLAQAKDRSFDVVLLDPMFDKAGAAGPLFDLVRQNADHAPLDRETLAQAQRVARRGVLVKDAAPGHALVRLGLTPRPQRRSKPIVFAWAPAR
jgi:16S rRNA (guanine1516-N2)-methyltransferase